MIYTANCKINLGLNILSKRQDGYHNLETVMVPVLSLYDMVEILPRKKGEVFFSSSGLTVDCSPEDNLCLKAYRLLQKEFELDGIAIHLHKVVPFGAGLGGGSSDAVSVLKGVNELYGLSLSELQLQEYAAALGSDTSFFVYNVPMLCSGRGEILAPVGLSLKGYYLTLVKPAVSVSTSAAYKGVIPRSPAIPITEIIKKDISCWRGMLINDFEESIFPRYPEMKKKKDMLYERGALYASMSGSGSTFLALSRVPIVPDGAFEGMFIHTACL